MPRLTKKTIQREYESLTEIKSDTLEQLAKKYCLTVEKLLDIIDL